MKRKLFFLSLITACLAILTTGTLAYFNAEDTAHNVITTGGVNVKIVEQMKNGDTLVDFPKSGISGIMPGTSVSKIVQVENTGEADVWVRVHISMSIKNKYEGELPLNLDDGTQVMTFSVMDGWKEGGDGYYYYNKPVAANQLTSVLFDEICFSSAMNNKYQNSTANILIDAQAVQAANNEIPYGGTVADVLGWPEE